MPGDLSISPEGRFADPADQTGRLRQAANQLEGVFIGMLFKQMEESGVGGEESLFGDSPASKQYSQLFHTALTEQAAGSLGLADTIFQQLATRAGIERQATAPRGALPVPPGPPSAPESP